MTAAWLVLFGSLVLISQAYAEPVCVTVTIIFIDDLDDFTCLDAYAKVEIAGLGNVRRPESGDITCCSCAPFWTVTQTVDSSLGVISVDIQLWDSDVGGDDLTDIDPASGDGDEELDLSFDLTDGSWSGDGVPLNQGFSVADQSDGAKIVFDISLSCTGDSDGDGLLDGWETRGLDADADGDTDLNLPSMGANPFHKDLFLELDWMPGEEPTQSAIQALKAAFGAAPVNAGGTANPDGQPGINLWVDTGVLTDPNGTEDPLTISPGTCSDGIDNGLDGVTDGADPDCLAGDNLGGGNALSSSTPTICELDDNFYDAKEANFDRANRRWVFRYAISGTPPDCDGDGQQDSGGQGEIGGNDFVDFNHDGGTVMHELGHNLNLRHGGNVDANCKPVYVSVMNYDNQFGINQSTGTAIIDYSPPRFPGGRGTAPLPTLVESSLAELVILDTTDTVNQFVFVDATGTKIRSQLNQQPNWTGDTDPPFETGPLSVNIDTSGLNGQPQACTNGSTSSTLTGFDDWSNVSLLFRQFGDSDDSAINPVEGPEPTIGDLLDLHRELHTADAAITKNDTPDPVVTGTSITYSVDVGNNGPNPATSVTLVDDLPAETGFQSLLAPPGWVCTTPGFNETGTVTCTKGEVATNVTESFTMTVGVDCTVNDATLISNEVEVSFPHTDRDLGNNAAATATTASNPPPAISGASVDRSELWPPNHKFANVTVQYEASDTCPFECSLDVSSNEPVDGTGDGDQAPDWLVVDEHHVQLRSERSGSGTGRVYAIAISCTDTGDASSSETVSVEVPHDQAGQANSSSGFNSLGTGFAPRATTFQLVVLSTRDFDARRIDGRDARAGNTAGSIAPLTRRLADFNRDGLADLAVSYSVSAAEQISSAADGSEPLAFRYRTFDGTYYLVPDVFRLGPPIKNVQ